MYTQSIILLVLAVIPASFAGSVHRASIQAIQSESQSKPLEYRKAAGQREAVEALFTLSCLPESFEVRVKVQNGLQHSTKAGFLILKDKPSIGIKETDPEGFLLRGSYSDLDGSSLDEHCNTSLSEPGCSRKRFGVVKVEQYVIVPGSVTPLAWVGRYEVSIECRLSPVINEAALLIKPNPAVVNVSICEKFSHSINITSLPHNFECIAIIKIESEEMRVRGFGYELNNCQIESNTPETHIPIIAGRRTVNQAGIRVKGRNRGHIGQEYELQIGLDAALTGKISCEVTRCRYGTVTFGVELPPCPTGVLASNNAGANTASRQYIGARSGQLQLSQGKMDLVVGNANARSSQRCHSFTDRPHSPLA